MIVLLVRGIVRGSKKFFHTNILLNPKNLLKRNILHFRAIPYSICSKLGDTNMYFYVIIYIRYIPNIYLCAYISWKHYIYITLHNIHCANLFFLVCFLFYFLVVVGGVWLDNGCGGCLKSSITILSWVYIFNYIFFLSWIYIFYYIYISSLGHIFLIIYTYPFLDIYFLKFTYIPYRGYAKI